MIDLLLQEQPPINIYSEMIAKSSMFLASMSHALQAGSVTERKLQPDDPFYFYRVAVFSQTYIYRHLMYSNNSIYPI